jgi:hypothetical protein
LLIDLHPTSDDAVLDVVRPEGPIETIGPLRSEEARERHARADGALARVVEERVFSREASSTFTFRRYGGLLDEIVDYVDRKWTARIDEPTRARARVALRPGSVLCLRENVSISLLRPWSTENPAERLSV